ncbi:MAG: hypothetical protein ACOYO1_17825 [Bacteroidales bacterium]
MEIKRIVLDNDPVNEIKEFINYILQEYYNTDLKTFKNAEPEKQYEIVIRLLPNAIKNDKNVSKAIAKKKFVLTESVNNELNLEIEK